MDVERVEAYPPEGASAPPPERPPEPSSPAPYSAPPAPVPEDSARNVDLFA